MTRLAGAALTGAWRHVGGGLMQMPLWEFPLKFDVICRPDYIPEGTRVINNLRLGQALNGEMKLDPPLKSLRLWAEPELIRAAPGGLGAAKTAANYAAGLGGLLR